MELKNYYLQIYADGGYSYYDVVFMGTGTCRTADGFAKLCDKNADRWRNSNFGNYDGYTREQRETFAKRWEEAKTLPAGTYDYYFNFIDNSHISEEERKLNIFEAIVADEARKLGITNYELKYYNV